MGTVVLAFGIYAMYNLIFPNFLNFDFFSAQKQYMNITIFAVRKKKVYFVDEEGRYFLDEDGNKVYEEEDVWVRTFHSNLYIMQDVSCKGIQ